MLSVLLLLTTLIGARAESEYNAAELYSRVKRGVVTIYGDEGKGSGFLFDSKGLLLTNYHVVQNSLEFWVQVDDTTLIKAKLAGKAGNKDLAVLWIPKTVIADYDLRVLQMSVLDSVKEGDRVFAVGSPWKHHKTITTGIVSKVTGRALISDVNLNPGNSGGPLFNRQGSVIAVTCFGLFQQQGTGLSGSIPVHATTEFLNHTLQRSKTMNPPLLEKRVLPFDKVYPQWGLDLAMKDYDNTKISNPGKYGSNIEFMGKKPVRSFFDIEYILPYTLKKKNVFIRFFTPPYTYKISTYYKKQQELMLKQADIPELENVLDCMDFANGLSDWEKEVTYTLPVVTIHVSPAKIYNALGQKENFYRTLSEDSPEVNIMNDGIIDIKLVQNGNDCKELMRSFSYVNLYANYSPDQHHVVIRKNRIASFTYDYKIFAPRDGKWPELSLQIYKFRDINQKITVEIPQKTIEQIWYDFEPLRYETIFRSID